MMIMYTLHNADTATILPQIDSNSVDMIFTDPPYNTTDLDIDAKGFNILSYLSEFKRVLKPNGWFFCFADMDTHAAIITDKKI